MTNAATARKWIVEALGEAAVAAHFAAISTALTKVAAFGIGAERIFGFWDWVGGRYSVWSAIGLSLMIAIGPENFREFLAGGRAMDEHFRNGAAGAEHAGDPRPDRHLVPQRHGLPGLCGAALRQSAEAPAGLSPAARHGIGRQERASRRHDGARATGPIVFGEPGTNGQHAFYQLIHQGTDVIPVDFLVGAHPTRRRQASGAAAGQLPGAERGADARQDAPRVGECCEPKACRRAQIDTLAPHKVFPGNRPSNTILYRRLDPHRWA